MTDEQQDFFEKKADQYYELIKERRNRTRLARFIAPRMGERVLDVGSGGVRDFYSSNTLRYVGIDFSLAMLRKGDEDVEKVCGDAMAMPFEEDSFDSLMYSSMLHHLTKKRVKETKGRIITALAEGIRCLRSGGNLIVIEPCVHSIIEKLERSVFFLVRSIFNLFHIPEVFLFSSTSIVRLMEEVGFQKISVNTVDRDSVNKWRWVSPIIGLPGFKIPCALLPVKMTIIEGKKSFNP